MLKRLKCWLHTPHRGYGRGHQASPKRHPGGEAATATAPGQGPRLLVGLTQSSAVVWPRWREGQVMGSLCKGPFQPPNPPFLSVCKSVFSITNSPLPEPYRKDPEGSAVGHLVLGGAAWLRGAMEVAVPGLHTPCVLPLLGHRRVLAGAAWCGVLGWRHAQPLGLTSGRPIYPPFCVKMGKPRPGNNVLEITERVRDHLDTTLDSEMRPASGQPSGSSSLRDHEPLGHRSCCGGADPPEGSESPVEHARVR